MNEMSPKQKVMQLAQQLDGIVTALNACIDDPESLSMCVTLIERAAVIAPRLHDDIDRLDTEAPVHQGCGA